MPIIKTAVSIDQSMDRVFEFVTTAANCGTWCPSSWTGPIDHSLRLGERVTEELSLAGRRARIEWTVRESRPPERWVIVGKTEDGGKATLSYVLTRGPNGTHLRREFVYDIPILFDQRGAFLSLRNRLQAESAESLRRLKRVIEAAKAAIHC
jgi:hypothetical protein